MNKPRTYLVYDHNDLVSDRFALETINRGFKIQRVESWETDITEFSVEVDNCIWAEVNDTTIEALFDYGDCVAKVRLGTESSKIWITVVGNTLSAISAVAREWRGIATTAEPTEEKKVPLDFWTLGDRGPQTIRRVIDVPNWHDVSGNYSASTLENLNKLFAPEFKPAHGGQLVLWHGKPGTGKTYALRALAYEWREWCKFEYVVDPEQFFGGKASYLLSVLMGHAHPAHPYLDDDDEEEGQRERWRCLIFEDTGELLSEDAADRSGQGLSRLLNVVDGLIGQGLRVMMLVTTNEELRSLHPAVSRPGRAALNVHFGPMSAKESREWARANNLILPNDSKEYTVAELFGLLEGHNLTGATVRQPVRLGFQPGSVN